MYLVGVPSSEMRTATEVLFLDMVVGTTVKPNGCECVPVCNGRPNAVRVVLSAARLVRPTGNFEGVIPGSC